MRIAKMVLKRLVPICLPIYLIGGTHTAVSESPKTINEHKTLSIRVTNLAQEAVQSRIFLFPPPDGREIGITKKDGTISLQIRCNRATKIQARPIGDAYYLSHAIVCDKERKNLHLKVYSVTTIRYLSANLINSASGDWYGVAAMAAFDLQHVGAKVGAIKSPYSEIGKIEGWVLPKQMDRVFAAWKGDNFARKINFMYHKGTLGKFIGGIHPAFLLHPKYYDSIKAELLANDAGKSVAWMHKIPFDVPTGQHAKYLAYFFVSKAFNLKKFPTYDRVSEKISIDVEFNNMLRIFQKSKNLKVSGDLDYVTLEAISKNSIRSLRNSVVKR